MERLHFALPNRDGQKGPQSVAQFSFAIGDRWAPVSLARRHRPYTAILDGEIIGQSVQRVKDYLSKIKFILQTKAL
jgi:hypothetical protein